MFTHFFENSPMLNKVDVNIGESKMTFKSFEKSFQQITLRLRFKIF